MKTQVCNARAGALRLLQRRMTRVTVFGRGYLTRNNIFPLMKHSVPASALAPARQVPLAASATLSCALAAICAAASLVGWMLDIDMLARFIPGWPMVHPVTAVSIILTAAAFILTTSEHRGRRRAGLLLLALTAVGALAAMLLPQAGNLPGGALQSYAGAVLLVIIPGAALATARGTPRVPAGRLLGVAAAALLFIAMIGTSFRLLLSLPPLVDVSLPSLLGLLLLSYSVAVVRPDRWLIERLTAEQPSSIIMRRLFPAAILLPLIIGWLEVAGEGAGIFDSAFGALLQTVLTMFGLGALVLWGTRRLDLLEAQRDQAERALRESYAELDRRVHERTAALEHANAALQESSALEQRLRIDAERANRAKDEFLAIVSHELRSPLNALRGWGFLLSSAKAPDAELIERATQAIKRNVDHQARLIDDLLDTSRIMSGKLNIERNPVNLIEVIRSALEVVKPSAAAKLITIAFTPEPQQAELEGDAARLQQIAVNLLSNAVKFTPEGGNVRASVTVGEAELRFAVTDSGSGIEPEFLPRVFDRFSQADTSTTRRHDGLGIGLALVRHLTELHGGTVTATSEGAGKGSTFTVELPRPEARSQETGAPGVSPIGTAGVSVSVKEHSA